MSKLFLISEEEKNRIINLHESATNRHYLSEQEVTNYDGKYDYKKENDKYYFKLKNTDNWKEATGEPLNAIKTDVFKGVVTDTNPKQNDLPFKNREEGNTFRKWVNETLPFIGQKIKIRPFRFSHQFSYN
jgi:seryl-tRNA synthetase